MTTSFWLATSSETSSPPLDGDVEADVCVVGGGITGLTAAYLLAREGRSVVLIEKDRIAMGETGRTTAHITSMADVDYVRLLRDFGEEGARLSTSAIADARTCIERIIKAERSTCGYRTVPGYLYGEDAGNREYLEKQLDAMQRAGVKGVAWTDTVPLPFPTIGGIRVARQGEFHVRDYLLPIAARILDVGGRIFEESAVTEIKEGRVTTAHGSVRARDIVLATHVPLNDRHPGLWAKMAQYRTYVVAAKLPSSLTLDGIFWDTADPYHYIRTAETAAGRFLLVGGEDHKTGAAGNEASHFGRLERYATARFGVTHFAHQWSGQVNEPDDGLPYIGESDLGAQIWMATGYSGTGMTFGTLAAMMLTDRIVQRENPYTELFNPTRMKLRARVAHLATEATTAPIHIVHDKLLGRNVEAKRFASVHAGEGKIVEVDGTKYAAARSTRGKLHVLSPSCTHLGCDVAWNDAEGSWDCPCHGSRFAPDGAVLNGPATAPLQPLDSTIAERRKKT